MEPDVAPSEPDLSDLNFVAIEVGTHVHFEQGEFTETSWGLSIGIPDEGDTTDTIFRVDGWKFDLFTSHDLVGWLDEVDADTAVFAPLVTGAGLVDELYETGSQLLIVNRVWLDPAWRGHGRVGLFLAGLGIKHLWGDAACVALHPSPFELMNRYPNGEVPTDEWKVGVRRLTTLWQELGFKPLHGNMVLDPTRLDLDRALARLAKGLGVAYQVERNYDDESDHDV